MNREQACSILTAFVITAIGNDEFEVAMPGAHDALREVILDAMTGYKADGITISNPWRVETVPCSYPTNWDGTPKVTCTGIDPMFGHTTSASTVYANGHTQEAVE